MKNFCDYLQSSITYDDVAAASDFPPRRDACPFPIKKYTIYGVRAPTEKVPPYFSGDYMIEVKLSKNGTFLNGYHVQFTVLTI